ncbi:hypothetical protein [Okeania sp. SIO3B5]|uniref:hypothetical protein n=1 Tax=Okeania sp. SIO3B5 TaxID=2607811 RepID=UPI0025D6B9DE|nr:hypothetical protein [Okeania sp. SIO3B5]
MRLASGVLCSCLILAERRFDLRTIKTSSSLVETIETGVISVISYQLSVLPVIGRQ